MRKQMLATLNWIVVSLSTRFPLLIPEALRFHLGQLGRAKKHMLALLAAVNPSGEKETWSDMPESIQLLLYGVTWQDVTEASIARTSSMSMS